jgi:hypothetical protein
MRGAQRRNFQAQMALKYCSGNARLTETVFGWGRNNVELGLAENRTGIICIGAQAALGGAKRWEECFPQAAETLRLIAESHAKPRPQFSDDDCLHLGFQQQKQSSNCNSRDILTNKCLHKRTMALILNRMGYRLRSVVKAKPQKKFPKQMPSSITFKPLTGKRTVMSNA